MLTAVKRAKRVRLNIMPFWDEKEMTVEKVAQKLGVNPRTVTGLRKGTEKGDWTTLINCSRLFNVPIEKLLVIEEDEDSSD